MINCLLVDSARSSLGPGGTVGVAIYVAKGLDEKNHIRGKLPRLAEAHLCPSPSDLGPRCPGGIKEVSRASEDEKISPNKRFG